MSEVVRSCGKFFCPEKCGKFFGTKHPIKKHLLSHRPQNEWPVVCLFCGKHFQCLNDLPKHLKTQQHINDSRIPKIGTPAWNEMLAKSIKEVWTIYFDTYWKGQINQNFTQTFVQFNSYSKCSNWRRISKLLLNFGCLFTFCYLDGANSIKTDLHICNLWTGPFVYYKSVI